MIGSRGQMKPVGARCWCAIYREREKGTPIRVCVSAAFWRGRCQGDVSGARGARPLRHKTAQGHHCAHVAANDPGKR
eukprot:6679600-Prymnesium_polylepis.1